MELALRKSKLNSNQLHSIKILEAKEMIQRMADFPPPIMLKRRQSLKEMIGSENNYHAVGSQISSQPIFSKFEQQNYALQMQPINSCSSATDSSHMFNPGASQVIGATHFMQPMQIAPQMQANHFKSPLYSNYQNVSSAAQIQAAAAQMHKSRSHSKLQSPSSQCTNKRSPSQNQKSRNNLIS